jgi:hypothetical protein
MKQTRIRIEQTTTVGELYRDMVKVVDTYGTEAKFKLHVGLDFVTLTPIHRERKNDN